MQEELLEKLDSLGFGCCTEESCKAMFGDSFTYQDALNIPIHFLEDMLKFEERN